MKTALLAFLLPFQAWAYISGSVATPAGSSDFEAGISFERGLLGARDVPETQQKDPASITSYRLRLGHNFGPWAGLQDFSVRLGATFFESESEGAFYPEDRGALLGLEVSANFVHDVNRIVGGFLRFTAPTGVLVEKFEKPRIDTFALGVQAGFEISDLMGNEILFYYGSGLTRGGARHQNASLVLSDLVSARFTNLVARGLTLKAGPFFESDLTERSDGAYGTTGFRGYRVGLTGIAGVLLTRDLGVEIGYVQKFSGAFFTATKDLFLSTRWVF